MAYVKRACQKSKAGELSQARRPSRFTLKLIFWVSGFESSSDCRVCPNIYHITPRISGQDARVASDLVRLHALVMWQVDINRVYPLDGVKRTLNNQTWAAIAGRKRTPGELPPQTVGIPNSRVIMPLDPGYYSITLIVLSCISEKSS